MFCQPIFNTIGTIRGSELPNEYVLLSAHFDSWDGGSGATDNGTGTLTMLEAMRILKLAYPNPRRTEDNAAMLDGIQAVINQDNGTGRIVRIASFACHGVPAFGLGAHSWNYGQYTWHTNRDTYDKVVFDELKGNATIAAMFAYLASEAPEKVSREPVDVAARAQAGGRAPGAMAWPACQLAPRNTNPRLR